MRLPVLSSTKQGIGHTAYGFRLRLWKVTEVEWGATIFGGADEVSSRFKEDNLTLAKLHLLAEARNRALIRWPDREFPSEETLLDSWEPMTFVEEQ